MLYQRYSIEFNLRLMEVYAMKGEYAIEFCKDILSKEKAGSETYFIFECAMANLLYSKGYSEAIEYAKSAQKEHPPFTFAKYEFQRLLDTWSPGSKTVNKSDQLYGRRFSSEPAPAMVANGGFKLTDTFLPLRYQYKERKSFSAAELQGPFHIRFC